MKKLLLILATLALSSCGFQYSDGVRVGVVQKFSKKGFFCKTWEGQLLIGAQNVMQPEVLNFSVEDWNTQGIEQVQAAMKSGKVVELGYIQKLFNPPCSPASEYRVTEVK